MADVPTIPACEVDGELHPVFQALAELTDRQTITVDHPLVQQAGAICLGSMCPIFDKCGNDVMLWRDRKGMKHWYVPKESELPTVYAGLLLRTNGHNSRIAEPIPVSIDSVQGSIAKEPEEQAIDHQDDSKVLTGTEIATQCPEEITIDLATQGPAPEESKELAIDREYSTQVSLDIELLDVEPQEPKETEVEVIADTQVEQEPTDEELLQIEKDSEAEDISQGSQMVTHIVEKPTHLSNSKSHSSSATASTKQDPLRKTVNTYVRSPAETGAATGGSRHLGEEMDLVRVYMKDIGQHTLLTKDDEVRLAKLIQEGKAAQKQMDEGLDLTVAQKRSLRHAIRDGEDANKTFINSNLRLVVSMAKRYQASGLPLLDLIQEGNLGLMHAVEKFDWRKGFKFSTYATWWIRQAITRGIANTGRTIRLPVHAGDDLARLQKSRTRLEFSLGRPATIAELAEDAKMPEEKVVEVLRFGAAPISLSSPVGNDGDAEFGDLIEDRTVTAPDEDAMKSLLPEEVDRLLAPLEPREREILKLRFGIDLGEPRTLEEVGEHFNLTRERIRQIEAKAMSKLRHPSADTEIKEFLSR